MQRQVAEMSAFCIVHPAEWSSDASMQVLKGCTQWPLTACCAYFRAVNSMSEALQGMQAEWQKEAAEVVRLNHKHRLVMEAQQKVVKVCWSSHACIHF